MPKDHRRQTAIAGYTLIEVLLTAAIVLLGMTGILTMQLVGIRITEDSHSRTKAVTLAYQMSDYVRANCPNLSSYDGFTACRSGSRHAEDDQNCEHDRPADTNTDPATIPIAQQDLNAWWDALDDARLPHWFAEIQSASNGVVRIAVQWDNQRATETSPNAAEQAGTADSIGRNSCLDDGQRVLPAGLVEVCLSTIPCPDL